MRSLLADHERITASSWVVAVSVVMVSGMRLGLNRASTLNLNIRYANLAMAMLAQAATYELRKNLTHDYKTWDARHLSNEILAWNDGDVRVKDDTIIVTFYGPSQYRKKEEYIDLPNKLLSQGINPKIPWLYDFKLDFRFK